MKLTSFLFTPSAQRGLLLLAGLLTIAGGCKDDRSGAAGGATTGGTSGSGTPPPSSNVSEVRIGYFANLTHAQAVLGVASGDFERAVAPAKVTTKVFNAGPSLVEALFASQIDIGYVGPGPALAAHGQSRGRGVRVIAGAAA